MKKTVSTLVFGALLIGTMNVYAIYNTNMTHVNPPLPEPAAMIALGLALFTLAGYMKKFK